MHLLVFAYFYNEYTSFYMLSSKIWSGVGPFNNVVDNKELWSQTFGDTNIKIKKIYYIDCY